MNITAAIAFGRTALRRDTWLKDPDWRMLLNAAQMEYAKRTDIFQADFELVLENAVAEYSPVSDVGTLYRITEDPVLNGTRLTRTPRAALRRRYPDLDAAGTPTHLYEINTFTFGLYPVPNAAMTDAVLYLHGNYFPLEITSETPAATELAPEVADHPLIVYGAIIQAERIDKDLYVSQAIKDEWERGILNARNRAATRLPGTSVVRRVGR